MNTRTTKPLLSVSGLVFAFMMAVPASAQDAGPEYTPTSHEDQQGGQQVAQQETGTDPRDFAPKFMPYYRYTELENGLENQALTAFGLYAFTKKFAMTYEIPLGYKNDVSGTLLNNGDTNKTIIPSENLVLPFREN